jgi:membrane-associated protease RseP (regulator of RpoE activity)
MLKPETRKLLHVALFVATGASTFLVFLVAWGGGVAGGLEEQLYGSLFFSGSVLAILLAHELGHYVMARAHGVDASWPYFIPVPLGFGTLGAVIRLRGRVPDRNALVDIGAGGPLAGLLIAVPLLAVGIAHSTPMEVKLTPAPTLAPTTSLLNLAALLGQWARAQVYGTPPPALPQLEVFGDNLLTLGLARLIHGPLPEGHELIAHPVYIAAWFGLLMTMLNLLPVGQLDGGHLTHAWFGERAEDIGRRVAEASLVLALFCSVSWVVWFFLITRVVGLGHPPVVDAVTPLTRGRKVTVVVTWVATALTFMPVPISLA